VEPLVPTIDAAMRFWGSTGLMARKVSTNGAFGLSLEMGVPGDTEMPGALCDAATDENANHVMSATPIKNESSRHP